ncbi:MAG TPA: UbiD family decarboxylase [Gaiellaceae bacterium]|nr:UbiD family decarboxylase [Gaiellaceae bacterium]
MSGTTGAAALDLRAWLDEMRDVDELVDITGADRDLEIGAITDLNAKNHGPALLFDEIPGFEGRGRVLSCSLSRPARLAAALGFAPGTTARELVEGLQGRPAEWRRTAPDFPVEVVERGAFDTITAGEDVDLNRYPSPLWHEGDGGYYIGTGCAVLTRDRETGWVNVGTYRVCVHDAQTLGLFIEPIHHGAIHLRQYHERGEPAPIAVSFGHHPLLYLASAMPMPFGMSELNYAGAMAGRPVQVVAGEDTGLPLPASSELAIEGFVHPDDELDEGPFGEFTGYFAGGRHPRPVIRVSRLYERSNPVIYGSLPAKPPFDHSYWRATVESSLLLDDLRRAGIPDVTAVWKHEAGSANFWTVVAIKQRYAGHAQQAGFAAITAAAGSSMGRYVVVVDDDVDVEDLEEVIWCVSTRTDPATSIQIVRDTPSNPLDPMLADLTKPWVTSRAVVNACRPFDRRDTFPRVVEVSPDLAADVRGKWAARLGWTR